MFRYNNPDAVMVLLMICSLISWILLIMKLLDFSGLNRSTNAFLEAYRGARSIADINRLAVSDEFAIIAISFATISRAPMSR